RVPPERDAKRHPRPLGIFLMALLHFLVGAIIMAIGLFAGAAVGFIGGSPAIVLIGCACFASLFIALGVGLLQGAKWAWWLSAFGHAWSLCGALGSIVMSLLLARQMVEGAAV